MIDIGRAVQHPTQDQDWPSKLGIGALITLVPILNFALNGYAIEHLKNTSAGLDVPLPTWDNLGDKFTNGLKLFVVTFILALPLVLVACVVTLAGGGLAALANSNEDIEGAAAAGFSLLALALSCLALIYTLFLVYVSPAVYIQYAKTKEIGACLRVGELLSIARTNTGDYLTIFAVLIGTSIILSLIIGVLNFIPCLGQILSIVIALVAAPYIAALLAHLCGQYARSNNILI
ncbi:MAG: DUF4013 domain-containing protein [Thermoflexales bacterium]|nr:DUF4013 domain-containing protein [Thermoflexales bacterium]MDW8350505.1 DUF4013 domain-containing protein [Anaerolineae bacterium]